MTDPRHEVHDRATWAELFFDLVLVFAVTQAAHLPVAQPDWAAIGRTVLLLAIMWWSWVGTVVAVHGVEDSNRQRFFLFACGLCAFVMAITAPHVFTGHSQPMLFAVAHSILRLLLWQAVRRKGTYAHAGAFGSLLSPYAVSLVSALLLIVAAAGPPGRLRDTLWILAVALAFIGPALLARRLRQVQFGATHLPERFGTFVIIALGEMLASVGARAAGIHLGVLSWTSVILIFLLAFGLWWLYFAYGFSAVEHSLRTNQVRGTVVRDVLSYGHMLLVTGLVLAAVGASTMVETPTAPPHTPLAYLLPMGATLYVTAFCWTRWRMFGAPTAGRTTTALLLAALTPTAPHLPQLAMLITVTTIILTLNAYEHWMVSTARPLPLIRRRSTG